MLLLYQFKNALPPDEQQTDEGDNNEQKQETQGSQQDQADLCGFVGRLCRQELPLRYDPYSQKANDGSDNAQKREWNKLIDRAMAQDFSWNSSAKQYEDLYRRLLG